MIPQWSPFQNIRHSARKPFPLFPLFLIAVLLPFLYYPLTQGESVDTLTTTLDIEHHRILDDSEVASATENPVESFFSFVAQSYLHASEDTQSLLALANPAIAYVVIHPGERREQIATDFGDKLNWTDTDKNQFIFSPTEATSTNLEGYYYPGIYTLAPNTSGEQAAQMMFTRFDDEVVSRYASSTARIIKMDTALKVASIIEREAAGPADRRLISGIIWNRIFAGMNLQMDATLQYAKGSEQNGWWPRVTPQDKYIDSPYNTYQNEGFPPSPIANPSLASIQAALNPKKTDCLFYLHDKYKRIHCAATYEEHLRNIKRYL